MQSFDFMLIVNSEQAQAMRSGLIDLLHNAVNDNASIGFVHPLTDSIANDYWDCVFNELPQDRRLWVAMWHGEVVGSVQLSLCNKSNGLHRAELQKLIVHTKARGQGVAKQLMQTAESYAKANGRHLLILDTILGSKAEYLYQRWGWLRLGEIPTYALCPDGTMHSTVIFYKQI